jgi:hypothetical protein
MNKSISSDGRIQSKGWSVGKKTTRRKTSINLDEDIGRVLDQKTEETGLFLGRIINDSLRTHFGMSV